MRGQEWGRDEVLAARMAGMGDEAHLSRHVTVCDLALHRAEGCIGRLVPLRHAARREVDVAAEAALSCIDLSGVAIQMIGKEMLRKGGIDASLVLRNQRVATAMARIHR